MAAVARRILLLAAVSLGVLACSSKPETQWYKPGPYTVSEFERDRAGCTKDRQLDEACLRQRGWIPLTGDRQDKPPEGLPRRPY